LSPRYDCTASTNGPRSHCVIQGLYLRQTFERLIEAVDKEDGPTIKIFWKNFNVLDAVKIIKDARNAVTESNLKGVWKKLCPEFVQDF
jgi:hypothetical protein